MRNSIYLKKHYNSSLQTIAVVLTIVALTLAFAAFSANGAFFSVADGCDYTAPVEEPCDTVPAFGEGDYTAPTEEPCDTVPSFGEGNVASVSVNGGEATFYTSHEVAWNDAVTQSSTDVPVTFTLLQDWITADSFGSGEGFGDGTSFSISKSLFIGSGKKMTLNLNGLQLKNSNFTLNQAIIVSGSLTIDDTSSNGDGTIELYGRINIEDSGTVEVKAGNIVSTNQAALYNKGSGNVDVSGGIVRSESSYSIMNNATGDVNIYGGKVYSDATDNGYAIYNGNSGAINISGGTVYSTNGSTIYLVGSGKINVSGGTVYSTHGNAINSSTSSTITISGGEVYSIDKEAINNTESAQIIVNGGIIHSTSSDAILNQTNGGAITIDQTDKSVETLIYTLAAEKYAVNVSGPAQITINGGSLGKEATPTKGGVNFINGDKISSGTITVNGGTIYAEGYAINGGYSPITINGGTIISTANHAISIGKFGSNITIAETDKTNNPTLICTLSAEKYAVYFDREIKDTGVTISGGSIGNSANPTKNGVWLDSGNSSMYSGFFDMTGGEIYAEEKAVFLEGFSSKLNVSGGTITAGGIALDSDGDTPIGISGGTILSTGACAIDSVFGNVTISEASSSVPTLVYSTCESADAYSIALRSNKKIEVTGGKIGSASHPAYNGIYLQEGTFTMSGGSIYTTGTAIYDSTKGGAINISGGTIYTTGESAIYNESERGGTINISGATITSSRNTIVNNSTNKITISNAATIINTFMGAECYAITGNGDVELNGGSIGSEATPTKGGIKMDGGTFTMKSGTIVVSDFYALNNNGTGQAFINGGVIKSLKKDAIVINNNGGDLTIEEKDGQDVLIYVAVNSADIFAVRSNSGADVTLKSGEIGNVTNATTCGVRMAGGTFTMNGGSIFANNQAVYATGYDAAGGTGISGISMGSNVVGATINVNGGTLISDNKDTIYNEGKGTVTISETDPTNAPTRLSNSPVTNDPYVISNWSSGAVVINGGIVGDDSTKNGVSAKGNFTMTGGTIFGSLYALRFASAADKTANISGGIIYSPKMAIQITSQGSMNVSGGTIYCNLNTSSTAVEHQGSGTLRISGTALIYTLGNTAVGAINKDGAVYLDGGNIGNVTNKVGIGVSVSGGNFYMTGGEINATSYAVKSGSNYNSQATISGGTITTTYESVLSVSDRAKLTVSGGNICKASRFAVYIFGYGTVTINEGASLYSSGDYAISCSGYGGTGTVNINGGSIGTALQPTKKGVYMNGGTFTMTGGEIRAKDVAIYNYESGDINVNGTVTSLNQSAIYNNSTGNVNINGGSIYSENSTHNDKSTIHNNSTGNVNINGGIISGEYTTIYNHSTGTVTVNQIDASKPTLLYTSKDELYAIECNSGGNVSITGGRIGSTSLRTKKGVYMNGGTFTMTGGEINSIDYAVSNYGAGAVNVFGDITSQNNSAIFNSTTGNVTINGGTLSGANSTIDNNSTGMVTVKGGTVIATGEKAIYNKDGGGIVIEGGTLSAANNTITNFSTGTITVSGGAVTATVENAIFNVSNGIVAVQGGTVSAAGGNAIFNNAGTLTVSQANELKPTLLYTTSEDKYAIACGPDVTVTITGGSIGNSEHPTTGAVSLSSSLVMSGGSICYLQKGISTGGAAKISGGTISPAREATGDYTVYSTSNTSGELNITGGELTGFVYFTAPIALTDGDTTYSGNALNLKGISLLHEDIIICDSDNTDLIVLHHDTLGALAIVNTIRAYTQSDVTFNLNGADFIEGYVPPTQYFEGIGFRMPYSSNLSHIGYSFLGWTATNAATDQDYLTFISTESTGDLEIFAKWRLNNPNISVSGYEGTYDNDNHIISVTATHDKTDGLTYSYEWHKGVLPTEANKVGTNSATHTVKAVADSDAYRCLVTVSDGVLSTQATSYAIVVSITKRTLTPAIGSITGKTYDGTTAASGTITLSGMADGETPTATASYAWTNKNAGTATVNVTDIALDTAWTANYALSATTIDGATYAVDGNNVSITQFMLTPAIGSITGKTYDGTTAAEGSIALTSTVSGEAPTATASYAWTNKNAGTDTVNVTDIILDEEWRTNYVLSTTTIDGATYAVGGSNVSITKIQLTPSIVGVAGKPYDGTTATTGTIALSGTAVDGETPTATATIQWTSPAQGTNTVKAENIALVGDWATNYQLTLTAIPSQSLADATAVISPAPLPDINAIAPVTYNGAAQTPVVVITGLTAEIDYTLTWDASGFINSATYTVTATGKGNYMGNKTKTYTINKADYDISGVTFVDGTAEYDGLSHSLTVGGTLPVGLDDVPLEVSYNGAAAYVADGAVTVTATFSTASVNYNVPQAKTAKITITPKDITGAEITMGSANTYNGLQQTQAVTAVTLGAFSVTYSVEGNTATSVGETPYTLTVTGNGNFTGTATAQWNLLKATYDTEALVFANKTVKRDGNAHSLAADGLPQGVAATYQNNGKTEVGIYEVTAVFSGDAQNYLPIDNRTATLTINKAEVADKVEVDAPKDDVIITNEAGIDPNTELIVDLLNEADFIKLEEEIQAASLSSGTRLETCYVVSLQKDGVKIAPDGEMTVRLLVPNNLRGEEFTILHKSGTSVSEIAYQTDGDYAIVTVGRLDDFIFSYKETSLLWLIILLSVLFIGEILITVAGVSRKKKKSNEVKTNSVALLPIALFFVEWQVTAVIILAVLCVVGGIACLLSHLYKGKANSKATTQAAATEAAPAVFAETVKAQQQKHVPATEKQANEAAKEEAVTAQSQADKQTETAPQTLSAKAAREDIVTAKAIALSALAADTDEDENDEDEDENDEEVGEVLKGIEEGTGLAILIRYRKSFTAKLIQSPEKCKGYYGLLKNEILSYNKTTSRISWNYDSINSGRNHLAKFNVRGKNLYLYLPLNPDDYADGKYKVERSNAKKYETVPCLYKIKNDRRARYAIELIATAAANLGLSKGEEKAENYYLPYETTEALIERKLIEEVISKQNYEEYQEKLRKAELKAKKRAKVSAAEVNAILTNATAEAMIETQQITRYSDSRKKAIINIDTLSAGFSARDTVDLSALIAKKLVPAATTYLKVLARGTIDKPLTVIADDFSIEAVKMLLLTGGKVVRLQKK